MKTIILAESIAHELMDGNSLFNRGGMAVHTARSSEEMLLFHRTRKADLLIADYALPGMDVVTLFDLIRGDADLREVSLILACENTRTAMELCKKARANQILIKPLDSAVFFSTISRMLMVQHRATVRVPMRLSLNGKNGKDSFVGLSHDLSVSGMLLHSGRMLQHKEQVECVFTVGSRVIAVDCVVVRAQSNPEGGFLYGVKFLNLDAKTFVLIEHFIKNTK